MWEALWLSVKVLAYGAEGPRIEICKPYSHLRYSTQVN